MPKNQKVGIWSKRLVQKLSLGITGLILVLIIGTASVLGFEYYTAYKLLQEGKNLLAAQKYDEAITKFTAAQAHWSPDGLKDKIEPELEKSLILQESAKSFERG